MFYSIKQIGSQSFRLVCRAFLQGEGLPFAEVLDEATIQAAFEAENVRFAQAEGDIYTPAITLWAFLSQVLHAGRLRSCAAAVSRVIALLVVLGRRPPSPDTGAYCRARAKLPEVVLRRLVYETADRLESQAPAEWLWLGRHVKVGDGSILTAPDTPANQEAWPQPRSQKPGLGFPLLRTVVLLSLATAAACGVAVGPYKGKRTGEFALLRTLLDRFQPGDVFLGDCGFCAYFLLALLLSRNVDVVVRQHQSRRTDFRQGQRLGKEDHVVRWQRPSRPEWMDEETYAAMPKTLTVRELKVRVAIRGFRVRQLVVVTTLTDAQRYPKAEMATLFRLRWHVELDLRNIKISLQMDDLRGKTPEMVRREIWAHWLTYNLIRKTIAQAALVYAKLPRQLSFAAGLDVVATSWSYATLAQQDALITLAKAQFRVIAWHQVGDRPNRVEPRAIKRHPKPHPWLRQPRHEARARLCGSPQRR